MRAALLLALVALAGCGSSDDDDGSARFEEDGFGITFEYPDEMNEAKNVTIASGAGSDATPSWGYATAGEIDRLVRFGQGNIYPHEETMSGPKQDRLLLTRATKANLSQIFGLYPDPNNEAQELFAALNFEYPLIDGVEAVRTDEAKEMARSLAREEALFAGTSSGTKPRSKPSTTSANHVGPTAPGRKQRYVRIRIALPRTGRRVLRRIPLAPELMGSAEMAELQIRVDRRD